MKVFVKGNVTVYEPSGTYQINIKEMKSDGIGDLYLAFQKLKAELEKEGYFSLDHKKKYLPILNVLELLLLPQEPRFEILFTQ